MPEETQRVVFRKWRDTDTVIALFPELPADNYGTFCDAYEHVGQHGGADYHGVVQATTPATARESASLARELMCIGYCLRPIRRTSYRHHERRREVAKGLR